MLSAAQVDSLPSEMSQRICSSLLFESIPFPPEISSGSFLSKTLKTRQRRQKPGKTTKDHERHFVVHNYHDHAQDVNTDPKESKNKPRGGVLVSFPLKLHSLLDKIEADGLDHVISWQPHGRCFVVHDPKKFVDHVMPKYFNQSKFTSFQRQLNLYGFQRLTRGGRDAGGYYHELFLRGKPFLCQHMTRTKIKGTGFKAASSPNSEPDFWRMPPVNAVTPCHSSDDEDGNSEISGYTSSSNSLIPQQQPARPCKAPSKSGFPFSTGTTAHSIPNSFSFAVPNIQASNPDIPPPSTASSTSLESLDEVLDDLFIKASLSENDETILDFVRDWCTEQETFLHDIEDDDQLGHLLESISDY
jgi:HSF-type DNA-binding